jgi:long-chain acyl-CoA synthetase
LTALLVPHWENVREALRAEGVSVDGQNEEALARHPAVRALLQRHIAAVLKDVSTSEQVKKFVVLPQPFSVAAEELTVSLKLRRNVVLQRHASALDALYRE